MFFETASPLLNNIIEIIIALCVVAVMFVASNFVTRADGRGIHVRSSDALERVVVTTKLLDGYSSGMELRNKAFDTILRERPTYVDLGGDGEGGISGGTNFSYSFWIYLRDPGVLPAEGMAIFLKGDPKVYETWKQTTDLTQPSGFTVDAEKKVVVKSPMVSVRPNRDNKNIDIVVDVNTTRNPHTQLLVTGTTSSDPTMRYNLASLVVGSWSMWTVTADDFKDESGRATGVAISFYINDVLIKSEVIRDDAVRPNWGDFHFFPSGDVNHKVSDEALSSIFIADVLYSSRPLSLIELRERLVYGVSNKVASVASSRPAATNILTITGQNIVNMANT